METIDIILLVISAVAIVTGAMRGFVRQAGTISGLVLAIVACRLFGSQAAQWLIGSGSEHEVLLRAVAYTAIFVIVFVGVSLLARLIHSAFAAVSLGWLNRVAGAVFRLGLWMVLTSLVLNIWLTAAPADSGMLNAKPWRHALVELAPRLLGYFAN